MKDREPLSKINIKKKVKAQIELGNLAMGSVIWESCLDLTKYNEVLYATAMVMAELCSSSMKTKKKTPSPKAKETHVKEENRKRNRAYARRLIDCDWITKGNKCDGKSM